jgi:hypothetical protein
MPTEPQVNVEVTLPPDSSPPMTENSTPSPVVIVQPPSTNGENLAVTDLQERVRILEQETENLRQAQLATSGLAIATSVAQTAEPEPEPIVETAIVPESSDDGPPESEPEKPAPKKHFWDHWI